LAQHNHALVAATLISWDSLEASNFLKNTLDLCFLLWKTCFLASSHALLACFRDLPTLSFICKCMFVCVCKQRAMQDWQL